MAYLPQLLWTHSRRLQGCGQHKGGAGGRVLGNTEPHSVDAHFVTSVKALSSRQMQKGTVAELSFKDHILGLAASPGTISVCSYLREQITMQQVLSHLGHWNRLRGRGAERRGPCPLHGAEWEHSRSFAVNVSKNVYRCFHPECSQAGNVLDFWAAVHNLSLYKAALDLAETFQLETTRNREEGARKTKPKPR